MIIMYLHVYAPVQKRVIPVNSVEFFSLCAYTNVVTIQCVSKIPKLITFHNCDFNRVRAEGSRCGVRHIIIFLTAYFIAPIITKDFLWLLKAYYFVFLGSASQNHCLFDKLLHYLQPSERNRTLIGVLSRCI